MPHRNFILPKYPLSEAVKYIYSLYDKNRSEEIIPLMSSAKVSKYLDSEIDKYYDSIIN